MTTELIPVGKPAFCDANVQFLMCDIHVSAQEAQEITGGHVLVSTSSMQWEGRVHGQPAC